MSIENIMNTNSDIINEHLTKLMQIELKYSQIIVEAMKYSLLSGGKRIRPCIFIEVLKLFNKNYDEYLDIACSIEMIHTYSLIHDDLPAMDNDTLRRGKPTNHIKFGEDIAILAGDSLLNYAYEILFKFISENLSKNNAKACEVISKYCGIYGMIGGQVSDVINENKQISLENLEYIHKNKTAKLIMASAISAAYVSEADDEQISIIKDYAFNLGMAFQISDDILDIISDEKILGKTVGKDENSGKNTYPKYFGLYESKKKLEYYVDSAVNSIKKLKDKDTTFFVELANYTSLRKF